MKKKISKKLRNDLILILALLLLAGALFLVYGAKKTQGARVVVRVDGVETAEYSLYANGTYELNGGTNILVIEDGYAWLEEANCPDKLCVNQGRISFNGQVITCLPNKLTVTVYGNDTGVDIVIG